MLALNTTKASRENLPQKAFSFNATIVYPVNCQVKSNTGLFLLQGLLVFAGALTVFAGRGLYASI